MDKQQKAEQAVDEIMGKAIDVVSLNLPYNEISITMKNGTVIRIYTGPAGELLIDLD